MELEQVKSKIKGYILENFLYGGGEDALAENDSFLEKGIIDSTGVLELVAFVEETFSVKIEDQDMIPENLDSVINLGNFVVSKMGNT